jgi:lipopolysaccharide export system protein LptA
MLGMVLTALLLVGSASAKQSDRNEPIKSDSTKAAAQQGINGVTILTGKVAITQGTLKVNGDVAHLYFDENNQMVRAVVDGKPATFHELDDNGNDVDGHSLNIDYVISTSIATLTKDAWVKQQGRGEAHGDKLVYDTNTSNMTGESVGNNLVRMVFEPKAKPVSEPPATTPKKP